MNFYLGKTYVNVCYKEHLWIICSDPSLCKDRVLILNATSYHSHYWEDDSCILAPNDHEHLTRKSYINYRMGEVRSITYLRKTARNNCMEEKEDANQKLLGKIHKGAKNTPFLKDKAVDLLKDQGFI